VAAVATGCLGQPGLVERRDLDQLDQLDPLHQQLRDPVTALHVDRRDRVEVDQRNLDLSTVARVDGARAVDDRKPHPRRQSRARMHQPDHPERDGHRDARADQGALTGRQLDVFGAIEIDPGIAFMGAAGQREPGIEADNFHFKARLVDTGAQITLDRVSDTRVAPHSVRYRERLWVPWWWWPPAFGLAGLLAFEVNLGVSALPGWLPYAMLFTAAAATLLWLGRVEIRVTQGSPAHGVEEVDAVELWAGPAHLPVTVITRSAEIPRSAKSAALGRQLDPAAYVLHRAWIGPLVLLVLDDPDDPTPYWLVSCRRPERVLSALRN
jgi:Protein of unknown function (DUF3093)